MSMYSIKVNFVCKSCRGAFKYVDEFIDHKKTQHFDEFQNISSIVFDERDQFSPASVTTSDNKRPQPIEGTSQSSSSKSRRKRMKLAKRNGAYNPRGADAEVDMDISAPVVASTNTDSKKKRNVFAISSDEEDGVVDPGNNSKNNNEENDNESVEDSLVIQAFDNDADISDSTLTSGSAVIPQLKPRLFKCPDCGHAFQTPAELTSLLPTRGGPVTGVEMNKPFQCPRKKCRSKSNSMALLLANPMYVGQSVKEPSTPGLTSQKTDGQMDKTEAVTEAVKTVPAQPRTKGMLYKCGVDNCRSEFLTPSGLEVHSEKKHGQQKIQFHCYVCGKAFDANDDLLTHVKEHEDEKRFKCTHEGCTFAFKVKRRLNKHLKTHEQKLQTDLSKENLEQNLIEIDGN